MTPSHDSDEQTETAPGVGAVFAALRQQTSGHGQGADRVRVGRLGGRPPSPVHDSNEDPEPDDTGTA